VSNLLKKATIKCQIIAFTYIQNRECKERALLFQRAKDNKTVVIPSVLLLAILFSITAEIIEIEDLLTKSKTPTRIKVSPEFRSSNNSKCRTLDDRSGKKYRNSTNPIFPISPPHSRNYRV